MLSHPASKACRPAIVKLALFCIILSLAWHSAATAQGYDHFIFENMTCADWAKFRHGDSLEMRYFVEDAAVKLLRLYPNSPRAKLNRQDTLEWVAGYCAKNEDVTMGDLVNPWNVPWPSGSAPRTCREGPNALSFNGLY